MKYQRETQRDLLIGFAQHLDEKYGGGGFAVNEVESFLGSDFEKGDVVLSGGILVLVTGAGDADYPSFSGTVLRCVNSTWEIGDRSSTWSTQAFEKTVHNLDDLLKQ